MHHTTLTHSHDLLLVVLSFITAMLASYSALDLAGRVAFASARTQWAWLAGGAVALGLGIWAMHFIGMLAFHLDIPISYHWPTVVVSLLAAVLASAIALFMVSRPTMGWLPLTGGGLVMGFAIAGMHYIGMAALRLQAVLTYDTPLYILSVVIAIVASMAALWLAFRFRSVTSRLEFWLKIASAVVMGFAIAGMHYTGMAAAILTPNPDLHPDLRFAVKAATLIRIAGPLLVGGLLLAYGINVTRQFREYSLRTKSTINLVVLILAVVIVGAAGASGLNNLNFQVDNLYNFMLIPIHTLDDANQGLSEVQESYARIAGGELSSANIEAAVSNIRSLDDKFGSALSQYETEFVTTVSAPFTQLLERNGQLSLQEDEVESLKRVRSEFDAYLALRDAVLPNLLAGNINRTDVDQLVEASELVQADMRHLVEVYLAFAQASYTDAVSSYRVATITMISTGVIVALVGLALLIVLLRSITRPLNTLRQAAEKVSSGDLKARAHIESRDEIGVLAATFNSMTAQLSETLEGLEQRVADRTHDMELASEVGRAISEKVGNLTEMLTEAAETIRSRFDLYYTQVYLVDPSGRNLVLRAGTGDAGFQLLQRGHRLAISSASLNGRAALERHAVIVGDTQKSSNFRPHPLLPLTRSELAIPLIVNNKVVGVLDMQNEKTETFSEANLSAFQVLAGQLAIAIQNTALFKEVGEARLAVEEQAARLTGSGWRDFMNAIDRNENIGYVFSQDEILPWVEAESPVFDNTLTVPIEITGATVGEVQLADGTNRKWSTAETEIVQAAVSRVGQHIENLRLFGQAEKYRSEAEQVSRRLTSEGWNQFLQTRKELAGGYSYNLDKVQPLNGNEHNETVPALSYPLMVRDEPIGMLLVDSKGSSESHASEVAAAVVEQLSNHIENLRLLEETQQRSLDLEESQTFLDSVVENLPTMLFVKDAEELRFVRWNKAAEELSGFERTTLVGKNDYDFFPKEEADAFTSNDRQVLVSGQILDIPEEPLETAHQGTRYLHTRKVPIYSADGKVKYLLGVSEDITERKHDQEILTQRANQLETVATLSSTASTVLDPDKLLQAVVDLTKERFNMYHTHIYLANDAWNTLLLGAGAGEVGRKMVAEEHAISMDAEKSLVARAHRERQSIIANDIRSQPDFLPNPLLPETRAEMAVPMIVGDVVLGVFDIQSDRANSFTKADADIYTTLASQVAVALQNARLYVEQAATVTQLRELDRLKSSFLANMSHELRTPLNSILGFTDVMLEGLDGQLTDYMDNDLRLIQKNGQHLLHLINDVLDMAKIESGTMNLNPEKFKIHEVLDEVTSITSTLASEKNLSLFIQADSDQDVEIFADNTRLRQVMINLVNNAIKFTENGNIALKATSLDGSRILITIKDTGIGIPSNQLESVFQEFSQVDTTTTRKAGGTGLGLPISRRLVEMHGGRLWAESVGISGEGSTFFVELPVEARITDIIEKQEK